MYREPWLNSALIDYPASLPISAHVPEIRQALQQHQVIVVAGETGSGKTTQLPKIMLELGRGTEKLIGHTQPRRIAARSVAQRLAEELQTELGQKIGYQVRFQEHTSNATYVKVMTDGILLAELRHDKLLQHYDTLIIDEAHERSLNIDFILGYLKYLLPKRPDLKIIITSATLDHQRFSSHFNDCAIIEVSGRGYPVEILYRPLLAENENNEDLDQNTAILKAIHELSAIDPRGDILIFFSGERDIRQAHTFLKKAGLRHTEIMPLFAKLNWHEQQKIFQDHSLRRIILATNIAETSLTVPGIKFVIDTGTARVKRYSYRSKIQRLPIEAISKASAKQRAGRCGRTSPGVCVRLYSAEDFAIRPDFTEPEILRSNLAVVILQMLHLRLGDVEQFPWLDAPEPQYWKDAYQCLQELQAIEQKNGAWHLNSIGNQLVHLPVDPRLGRMIIAAKQKNCLTEILVIVSALSIADIWERPYDHQQQADQKHRELADDRSDFLSYLKLWYTLQDYAQHHSNKKLREFCHEHFVSYLKFREWRDLYQELFNASKIDEASRPDAAQQNLTSDVKSDGKLSNISGDLQQHEDKIHQSILSGVLSHIAMKLDEKHFYLATRQRKVKIFPGSFVAKKQPPWIMAVEFSETQQVYARVVAPIDPLWLDQLAAQLLKHHYHEPHWNQKRGEVVAFDKISFFGLPLFEKRRVSFERIDLTIAREIFIKQALVQRQFATHCDFWRHNETLLKKLEQLEEQSRTRHYLPDEDILYRFYDQSLPANIANQRSLEKWYKDVVRSQKDLLKFDEQWLTQHASAQQNQLYPAEFVWHEQHLKLTYQFAPGSAEDGVTLTVPVDLLPQLPSQYFDWLVPGFLPQKIEALMKALPKEWRRQLIPIPESAKLCVTELKFAAGNFYEQLSLLMQTLFEINVPVTFWVTLAIPDFLQFNFKVVEGNKTLAIGRNLSVLQQQFAGQAEVRQEQTLDVYKLWPPQILPLEIDQKQANLVLKSYVALKSQDDGVVIAYVERLSQAQTWHRLAVAKLLQLKASQALQYCERQLIIPAIIQGWQKSDLKIKSKHDANINKIWQKLQSDLGTWADFWQRLQTILILMTFVEDFWQIRDQTGFDACYQTHHQDLVENATTLAATLQSFITQLLNLNEKFDRHENDVSIQIIIQELLKQKATLCAESFWIEASWDWLARLPYYLAVLNQQFAKNFSDLDAQLNAIQSLTQLNQQYQKLLTRYQQQGLDLPEALIEWPYLWQELRLSLLSALKTATTVSVQRLQKILSQY